MPNAGWSIDPGTAIDLDITTRTNAVANFVVIRLPNNSSAPTDAECVSAIGRTPISGDLCTINYNSGIASIQYKYTTGWAIFQKYITADIVQAQTLSAFTANLGTVTAGEVIIGSSPAISGTTMTGTGSRLYSNGRFITGNSTTNLVFDGSTLTLNGVGNATFGGLNYGVQMPISPSGTAPSGYVDSFVISKAGFVQITLTGEVGFSSNTTAYPGIYAPVTVSLRYLPTGTLPGSATGVSDTFNIRLQTPVVKPAFGAAVNVLQLPLSWTRITNLSAGTYAIFICSDAAFFDTAGNLGYAVPVTDRLFTGRIDVFQPTV